MNSFCLITLFGSHFLWQTCIYKLGSAEAFITSQSGVTKPTRSRGGMQFAYVTQLKDDSEKFQRLTRGLVKQLKQVFPTKHNVLVFSCGYHGYPLRHDSQLFTRDNVKQTTEYIRRLGARELMLENCPIVPEEEMGQRGHRITSSWETINQCFFCLLSRVEYKVVLHLDNDVLLTNNFDHIFPAVPPGFLATVRDISTLVNGGLMAFGVTSTLGQELMDSIVASTEYTCRGGINNSDWNRPLFADEKCQPAWNKIQSFYSVFFEQRKRLLLLDQKYDYAVNPRIIKEANSFPLMPLQDVEMFHFIGCKKFSSKAGEQDYQKILNLPAEESRKLCKLKMAPKAFIMSASSAHHLCELLLCQWRMIELASEAEIRRGLKPLFPKNQDSPKWTFSSLVQLSSQKSTRKAHGK